MVGLIFYHFLSWFYTSDLSVYWLLSSDVVLGQIRYVLRLFQRFLEFERLDVIAWNWFGHIRYYIRGRFWSVNHSGWTYGDRLVQLCSTRPFWLWIRYYILRPMSVWFRYLYWLYIPHFWTILQDWFVTRKFTRFSDPSNGHLIPNLRVLHISFVNSSLWLDVGVEIKGCDEVVSSVADTIYYLMHFF
jgi:hypothetical protein